MRAATTHSAGTTLFTFTSLKWTKLEQGERKKNPFGLRDNRDLPTTHLSTPS